MLGSCEFQRDHVIKKRIIKILMFKEQVMAKKTSNPKKILIIEDETMLQGALVENFESEGYLVRGTATAKKAFEMMQDDKPDLIITDLVMLNFDGFEILQTINENLYLKDVPVVVLSNLYDEEYVEKAKSLGAVDFIVKSDFSLQEIADRVKEVLK